MIKGKGKKGEKKKERIKEKRNTEGEEKKQGRREIVHCCSVKKEREREKEGIKRLSVHFFGEDEIFSVSSRLSSLSGLGSWLPLRSWSIGVLLSRC